MELCKVPMETAFMKEHLWFTDTSFCKTRQFTDEFWECRVEQPKLLLHCPYCLRFGEVFFCRHPERSVFGADGAKTE